LYRKSQKTGFTYLDYVVKQILTTHGQAKLSDVIDKCGVTQKYVIDLFKKRVGLSPKQLSNLVRLNHFIAYKNKHPQKNLTACGYEAGFFDQAHLIKSLQQVAGMSPKNYFKIDHVINNIFCAF
jgi:methylphosphotriester-DNA--protein-cysteine methyltransferase